MAQYISHIKGLTERLMNIEKSYSQGIERSAFEELLDGDNALILSSELTKVLSGELQYQPHNNASAQLVTIKASIRISECIAIDDDGMAGIDTNRLKEKTLKVLHLLDNMIDCVIEEIQLHLDNDNLSQDERSFFEIRLLNVKTYRGVALNLQDYNEVVRTLYHGNNIEELKETTLNILKAFAGSLYVNNLQMAQERGCSKLLETNIERQCIILKDLELSNDCSATTQELFNLRNASIMSITPCLSASGAQLREELAIADVITQWNDSPSCLNIILKKAYFGEQHNSYEKILQRLSANGTTVLFDKDKNKDTQNGKDLSGDLPTIFMAQVIPNRPKELECDVVRFQNNKEKWVAFVGLLNGYPYEIFTGLQDDDEGIVLPKSVLKGKIIKHSFTNAPSRYDFQFENKRGYKTTVEGLSEKFNPEYWNYAKLISGVLRYRMPIEHVIKLVGSLQLKDESINTWTNGVVRALKKYISNGAVEPEQTCSECGERNFIYEDNHLVCKQCGAIQNTEEQ